MKEAIKDLDIFISDGNYSSKYPRSDEFVEEGIPFIRGNNMVEGDIDDTEMYYITPEKHEILKKGHVKGGDVLITTRGNIGQVAIVPMRHEDSNINAQIVLLRPNPKEIYNRYLLWALLSRSSKEQFCSLQTGTALKQLPVGKLAQVEIYKPDIRLQYEIAERLDKVYRLIQERTKELELLDELIKARFVEMFVSKNYPREDLDSLSYGKGEYGAQSASMEYDPSRPRYVRITDINDDGSLNEDYVCSSNTDDDETYKLTYGDFCFARMGATVGKTYAYKSGNQIFAGYLIRYKLRLDRVIPEYLYEFTRLDEYWKWVLINQSGAAQPGINAKKYGSLLIPIAPLEEQQKFAEFVKQVDKSKVVVMIQGC